LPFPDRAAAAGPFVFAAAYAVAATLLLPAAPFTIGAGLLFGPVLGTATALVGATAGATGAFLLGRVLGRGAVEQFGGQRVAALDRYLSRRGFVAVLLVRLVPLFPFNLISVVAGVTGIPLRDYRRSSPPWPASCWSRWQPEPRHGACAAVAS
jgi:uncharacterized membrane protein YdjX (TVP38/TMEM64 family)